MSGYSVLHFALSAVVAAVMLFHLTLWVSLPRERAQLWLALCYGSFALLFAGAAGAGTASGAAPRTLFLAAGVPATLLHVAMTRVIWTVFGMPVRGARRWLLLAIGALSAILAIERVLALVSIGRTAGSFEDLLFGGPLGDTALGLVLAPLVIWIVEASSEVRRHLAVALSALAVAVTSVAMIVIAGAAGRQEYLFLAAVPFLLFASSTVVAGYVRSARRAEWAGEWRLVRPIASGGMGELFVAEKTGPAGFRREVALKRILPGAVSEDAAQFEARFLSEARLAAKLSHPNVVAVYDIGRLDSGGWFMAMELLHGKSLAEIGEALEAKGGRAPVGVVAAIGEQLARGLAAAHETGVVHRDVSPENVMVTNDGVVKVIDFGIAKTTGERDSTAGASAATAESGADGDLTSPGRILGKLAYLAPEQLEGKQATARVDVWAAGVVLYQLATGMRPYRPDGEPSRLPQPHHWRPASTFRPEIPPSLDEALTRALAWRARDRFASAHELADALRKAAADLPYADLGSFVRSLEDEKKRPRM